MAIEPASPARIVFGPFEVDVQARELRKRGGRVRLSGQPFQILLLLLATPAELVTREALGKQLWRDGTFVDFEHGLNAAINKLRRALDDSAELPRYIETVPGHGYRFIGTLQREPVVMATSRGPVSSAEPRRTRPSDFARWSLGAVGICITLWFAVSSQLQDVSSRQPIWRLTRLTADPGISDEPALSPDGTLVAFSSDRTRAAGSDRSGGGLDLYVKQVSGGSPIRLTFDGAGNMMPSFSPDGSRIVFRSSREGGGIYEVRALGGDARLIAQNGFHPRYSPDGSQVAYWVGSRSVAASVPASGAVWVVPVRGGQPQRVGADFSTGRHPIWHKDGKHVLMVGYTTTKAFDPSNIDWWVVATDGSGAVRTGAYETLVRAGLQPSGATRAPVAAVPEPRCWSASSDNVTFSIEDGNSWNLWEVEVSARTGKTVGSPQRLTTGAGNDLGASCATGGLLAFAKVETRIDAWLLPVNLDLGTPIGALKRVTQGPPSHENPSLSDDGRFVTFASDQSGRMNVWRRELATGNNVSVAASPFVQRYALSNASGGRIAFSVYDKDKRFLYVSGPGGSPERLCEGCLRATDWSRDQKSLLIYGGDPYQTSILDVASHQQSPLVKHPAYHVLYAKWSPDSRWISFTARVQPANARIVVAPVDKGTPIPESRWVTIADVGPNDYANWSPDGNTLYFTSGRDGYSCLWGQRIDATSRQPIGEPFTVYHFHGELTFDHRGWSAAAGRIAISLVEKTGNIWMMSHARER